MLDYEIYYKIKSGNYASGNICKYIRCHGLNIKCYECRYERDTCYFNQKRLSKYGYTPKAFERFCIYNYYCYTTEHVNEILQDEDDKRIEKFCDRVWHNIRFDIVDPQPQNFGVVNGNLVLVDCE